MSKLLLRIMTFISAKAMDNVQLVVKLTAIWQVGKAIYRSVQLFKNWWGKEKWITKLNSGSHSKPRRQPIYSYHTITDVCTTALLRTKPSSDDDSGFRHGFGAEASLPLAQSAPGVFHDTTRLCHIVVTLWECHVHADAVRALSWIFSMNFLLSDGRSLRLVNKNRGWVGKTFASDFDRKFICYPAISDTFFSQIIIFFQHMLMCPVEIFFKRDR